MFIKSEPKGKIYEELIEIAFEVCDEFILVLRSDVEISENANSVIERLSGSLKCSKEQFVWAGTEYFGENPAKVFYFKTDEKSKSTLLKVANSFHEWFQPNLPEDLSFYKDGSEWLVNTAHEYSTYIYTTDSEIKEKILKIEGIEVKE